VPNLIRCRLCNKELFRLEKHVAFKHNITVGKYLSLFPGSRIVSEELENKISRGLKSSKKHKARFEALRGVPRSKEIVEKISQGVRRGWREHPEQREKAIATMQKRAKERGLVSVQYDRVRYGHQTNYLGFRKDLGLFLRSETEAIYLRYLLLQGLDFVYEPKRFQLWNKTGKVVTTYLPDVYLPQSKEYLEIKAPRRGGGKEKKIALFRKCYPKLRLRVINDADLWHAKRILRDCTLGVRKRHDTVRSAWRHAETGRNDLSATEKNRGR
jgi:hypothetical protein